jgi:ABC-type cobalamin/Fe3+-siderophores transport system ATPase subunit
MIVLEVNNLAIGYGRGVVADGIGFSLRAGSVTCLLGPNGVGKTTLFRTLLGLIAPLAGDIRLGGERLAVLMSTHEPDQAFAMADQVVVLGRNNFFCAGPAEDLLTSRLLSELYGIDLVVERTPSGRRVVGVRTGGCIEN